MKLRTPILLVLILAGPLIWVACGGNGPSAGGGIGGTGVTSAGVVTATGSIFVNGVKYETDTAAVRKEDRSFPADQLTEGMLVRVSGSIDTGGKTGTAGEVDVLIALRGVIEAVGDWNVIILGQHVQVEEETLIDIGGTSLNFADLEAGDAVEVSGLIRPSGTIVAARVEVFNALPRDPKVAGAITEARNGEFRIGDLRVLFPKADLIGFEGEPQAGDYAEVLGELSGVLTLSARQVRKMDDLAVDSEDVELEGYLDADMLLISPLGPVTIIVNARTVYTGGAEDDLTPGVRLEAKGVLQGGDLLADSITFAEKIKVEAALAGTDLDAGQIVLLNLPGLVVQAGGETRFQDRRSHEKHEFPAILETLTGNEWLWIKGRLVGGDGTLMATQIRIDAAPADLNTVVLNTPADENSTGPDFKAAGLTVRTDPSTAFENADGGDIQPSEFFELLTTGTFVRVRGRSVAADTVLADQVSLEE